MELAECSAVGSSWRWRGQGAHTTACCPPKPTSLPSSPAFVCVPFCLAEPVPPSWPTVPSVAAGGAGGRFHACLCSSPHVQILMLLLHSTTTAGISIHRTKSNTCNNSKATQYKWEGAYLRCQDTESNTSR